MNQAVTVQQTGAELFDKDEWAAVNGLLARFNDAQKLWLSGYLAALPSPEVSGHGVNNQDPGFGTGVLVAFGGETGNSESLAMALRQQCEAMHLRCRMEDLAQVKLRHLSKEKFLVLICSTHGEGDPPETITSFYHDLSQAGADSLTGLEYTVLALGDSSYEHYCKAGRDMDLFLTRAGAVPFAPREEVDVDFTAPAEQWMTRVCDILRDRMSEQRPGQLATTVAVSATAQAAAGVSKSNPGTAQVLEKSWLSEHCRASGYWHLELLVDNLPACKPGDALGVFPENPDHLVENILHATGLDPDQEVIFNNQPCTLGRIFKQSVDLVVPGKNLLGQWAGWSGDETLLSLQSADAIEQRQYLKSMQLMDLFQQFPARPQAQVLVDNLRPLQPRLYDIANFPDAAANEIHLLVKNYRYAFGGRMETGIASSFFHSLDKGSPVNYYLHTNKKFHLPEDSSPPLILIAYGSGIAPFRAFVQSFRLAEAIPPCWIIFLERSFEEDFLYQMEWQQALMSAQVSHFDGLFDADNPVRPLSHCLYRNREQLRDWLERGAHFYLCGEREILKTCEEDISGVLESLAGTGGDELWRQLGKAGQIHRNYY